MNTDEMRGLTAAGTSGTRRNVVIAHGDARHRSRLFATMVQGTAAVLPEAWRPYRNVDEARLAAREMVRHQWVLRS